MAAITFDFDTWRAEDAPPPIEEYNAASGIPRGASRAMGVLLFAVALVTVWLLLVGVWSRVCPVYYGRVECAARYVHLYKPSLPDVQLCR